MAFFKNILNRLGRGGGEPQADDDVDPDAPPVPTIRLAVFGKHPAWDDHIDDLGLDTSRLVAVKRAFYLQGVGANLDAGTWDRLGPDQRLPRFDHLFVWRSGPSTVVGRAVASTDGKGRGRYPLVACAQCVGVPADRLAADVAPLLEEALARCGQTTSRAGVLDVLADVRGRLQRVAAEPPTPPGKRAVTPAGGTGDTDVARALPAAAAPPPTLSDLVVCPELDVGGVKLYAVYFQVEREMGAFAPAEGPARTAVARGGLPPSMSSPAAVHLRVPACTPVPAEAARVWIELLATRLDPTAPILAIAAVGRGWVDLIVGDPGPHDFYCLLAARQVLPFTTDIPFNLNAGFVTRAAEWIRRISADGPPAAKPPPVPAPPVNLTVSHAAVEPTVPSAETDPVVLEASTEPGVPADPVVPQVPAEAVAPDAPAGSAVLEVPASTVTTVAPANAVTPVPSAAPADPADPADPAEAMMGTD